MPVYILGVVFTVWMAVDAVRSGNTSPWLWIILIFPPVGGLVYFFAQSQARDRVRHQLRLWHFGRRELEHVAAKARRIDRSEAWTEYATQLRERRRYQGAVDAARQAVERDSSNLEAHYELGLSLIACGRHQEALEPLAKVVAKEPGLALGEAAFLYAEALVKTGSPEEALPHLERLAETSSRPRFLYGLASVQAQLDQRDNAHDTLQRILDEAIDVPAFARREVRGWVRRARRAQRGLRVGSRLG